MSDNVIDIARLTSNELKDAPLQRSGPLLGQPVSVDARVGSPLLDLPNVIVSPHMGTHTRESLALMGRRAADAVLCVLQGKPPEFAMNPEVWNHRKEG